MIWFMAFHCFVDCIVAPVEAPKLILYYWSHGSSKGVDTAKKDKTVTSVTQHEAIHTSFAK